VLPAEPVRTAEAEPEKKAAQKTGAAGLPARIHPTETEEKEKTVFSKLVRAVEGQVIEVPFSGTGWVFTGEKNGGRGAVYQSRKNTDTGQVFTFNAKSEGEYYLKFSKQDFVNNKYLSETVKVIVVPYSEDLNYILESRVAAVPENILDTAVSLAPEESEEAGRETETVLTGGEGATESVKQTTDIPIQEDYFNRARNDFNAKNYPAVIAALDNYKEKNPSLDDETYWMYGQSFEANSPARNIKAALDSYKHITNEFPLSRYYDGAKERISYLNKFYFNIR